MTYVFALLSLVVTLRVPTQAAPPKIDFNGDGRADLFVHNIFTGELSAWLGGGTSSRWPSYGTVALSSGWVPIGTRDFNGDGRTDLLWRNAITGELVVWLLDGGHNPSECLVWTVASGSGGAPIGTGDFNGDGRTNLLWRNAITGELVVWLLNGGTILQNASYGTVASGSGWVPIGTGDFNGDGRTDLLWYNNHTGELVVWLLNGGTILQSASYGAVALSSGWVPIGTGDFNGDGRTDLLWYNTYTNAFSVWLLNGGHDSFS